MMFVDIICHHEVSESCQETELSCLNCLKMSFVKIHKIGTRNHWRKPSLNTAQQQASGFDNIEQI